MTAAPLRGRVEMRDGRGFTLIEVLVATLLAVIVAAATLAIVIVSVHLTSNYTDRVDATQQGRTVLEKITQALNSSCVSASTPPILAASDDNDVWFYSSLTDSPTVTPNKVEISLSAGALVENTYAWVSGTTPATWTFSSTPTSFVLMQHAVADVVGGVTQPVFRYYGYGSGGAIATSAYSASSGLGATNAATTAMVSIDYQALPTDNWSANGRGTDFNGSVVLRLTPASSASGATNTPCT